MKVIGLTKIRNESLILQDTLDHYAQFCDEIYVYDDGSTDGSDGLAYQHSAVTKLIRGPHDPHPYSHGRQRQAAMMEAITDGGRPDWFCSFDADERLAEIDRKYLENVHESVNGILLRLFDFYITPADMNREYAGNLTRLRDLCGPEYRDTLIFWRGKLPVVFNGEVRSPNGVRPLTLGGYVRHYGKAISEADWERRCRFYAKNYPHLRAKWLKRMGKALHSKSDFGRKLMTWNQVLKGKGLGPCLYAYGS